MPSFDFGLFSLAGILIAFAGGIFGASFGALMSFVFIAVICGVVGGIAAVDGSSMMVWTVGFGADGVNPFSFYAPQIAWTGAIFAVGYAKKRGYLDSGMDIVSTLLGTRKPDALLMGGVGGVIGYLIVATEFTVGLNKYVDPVAFAVVAAALIGKLVWDGSLFGKTPPEVKQLRGGRLNANAPAWLPYLSSGLEKLLFGGALGLGSAFVATTFLQSQSEAVQSLAFIVPWTVAVFSLIGFFKDGYAMPASHHIAYCGAFGAIFSYSLGTGYALLWGAGMGILAAFAADFLSKMFNVYGNPAKVNGVWVDPPTSAILLGSIFLRVIFGAPGNGGGGGAFVDATASVIIPVVIIVAAGVIAVVDQRSLKRASVAVAA